LTHHPHVIAHLASLCLCILWSGCLPRPPLFPYTTLFRSIASIGMTFVILLGDIDLSIGTIMSFVNIICAYMMVNMGMNMVVAVRSEEHTSELQSRFDLVCRLLLEK